MLHVQLVFHYHLWTAEGGGVTTVVASRQSDNWAGYTETSPGRALTGASGDFVVPKITGGLSNSRIGLWIGLGDGPGIIQAGIGASRKSGWGTWWETVPGPVHQVPLSVLTGDTLNIAIAEVHPAGGMILPGDVYHPIPETWRITIRNLTSGDSWGTTTNYSGPTGSAEWITEAPETVAGPVPLVAATGLRFWHCMIAGGSTTRVLTPVLMLGGPSGVQATPTYYSNPTYQGPMPPFSVRDWVA